MKIVINTPGWPVNFNVPIMKVKSYSLAQIFRKNLYFLLQFYIFNLEKNFLSMKMTLLNCKNLKQNIFSWLGLVKLLRAVNFARDRRTILEMSKRVPENTAAKYKNIQNEMKEIMDGRVLDY